MSVVAAADSDPVAVETYAANLESLVFGGNLADPADFLTFLRDRGICKADVVAGGPPCQPFSRAGASKIRSLVREGIRPANDARASLWQSFVTVVEELQPRVVLLENVPDMARWNDGEVLLGVLQSLREAGFVPDVRIIETFRHGVPQHRARLFVVGTRHGHFSWPRGRAKIVTLRDAIGDLPRVPGNQTERRLPYGGPRTAFQRAARRGVSRGDSKHILDHCTRGVRADDLEAYLLLKPGQTYRDLPERLQRYRADIFDDKYKRLVWNELSRTITAHIARDGYWYIHPQQHRTLSIREAARLQTFPDWFRFAGHPTVQLRQIGNAVPPAMAQAMGRQVQRALADRRRRVEDSFADRLLAWHRRGNRRPIVWRTGSAWDVALAELCLARASEAQRTDLYRRLIAAAPGPRFVARNARRVRADLAALGFGRKANVIISLAREVSSRFKGAMPNGDVELRSLPGIGNHLAAQIRVNAFGARTIVLDANAMRVASRFTGRPASSRWIARLELYKLAGHNGPTGEFNYAILDLGASICRPQRPRCRECPVADACAFAASSGH